MESNGTIFGEQMVLALALLALFGMLFNIGIERYPWLSKRRSAEQVVIGVLVTVLVSGLFIGWQNVVIVLVLFVASGAPMLIGSWIRAAHDDDEAKRVARDELQK